MKSLILLRHAKSSWDDASLDDFDRPLNSRGQKAAPLMGKWLRNKKLKPDLILSSPALRAKETTRLVCEKAGWSDLISYEKRIYEASVQRLLSLVTHIADEVELAVMVGHNPGFEELLEALTGETGRMPTAAAALIELNVEKWPQVKRGSGKLKWLTRPKDIESKVS